MDRQRELKNLALIGFMGTGKTTVGHLVASLLDYRFVDTDERIERAHGRRISDIFAHEGEERFREYEQRVVAELAGLEKTVIATGGGVGSNPDHLARLKEHALVVCLWATPEAIWDRVGHQKHRPLLCHENPFERIRDLLTAREAVYRQADVLINTELRSMKEVAHQVCHHYRVARRHGR